MSTQTIENILSQTLIGKTILVCSWVQTGNASHLDTQVGDIIRWPTNSYRGPAGLFELKATTQATIETVDIKADCGDVMITLSVRDANGDHYELETWIGNELTFVD